MMWPFDERVALRALLGLLLELLVDDLLQPARPQSRESHGGATVGRSFVYKQLVRMSRGSLEGGNLRVEGSGAFKSSRYAHPSLPLVFLNMCGGRPSMLCEGQERRPRPDGEFVVGTSWMSDVLFLPCVVDSEDLLLVVVLIPGQESGGWIREELTKLLVLAAAIARKNRVQGLLVSCRRVWTTF
ncbi:hypothetical protein L7F22_031108 [Adiantum nelumboides]|nr:hypothetical protein [Adiantum nelumboides]